MNQDQDTSRVVLVYIVDVKNKVLNADREFFEFLANSSWKDLSRRMIVLVNKCDKDDMVKDGEEDDDGEETINHDELVKEIEEEVGNYGQSRVLKLSLKDAKEKYEPAVRDWNTAVAHIDNSLALQKAQRAYKCLQTVGELRAFCNRTLSNQKAQQRDIQEVESAMRDKQDLIKKYQSKEFHEKRTRDIKEKLVDQRSKHREAFRRRTFSMEGERTSPANMAALREEMGKTMDTMVQNDISAILETDSPWFDKKTLGKFLTGSGILFIAHPATLVSMGTAVASAAGAVAAAGPVGVAIALMATGGAVYAASQLSVITPEVKMKEFERMYDKVIDADRLSKYTDGLVQDLADTQQKEIVNMEDRLFNLKSTHQESKIGTPEMMPKYVESFAAANDAFDEIQAQLNSEFRGLLGATRSDS